MPIADGWRVALDLGRDLGATEIDAMYIEQALADSGVPVVFAPWHPALDVLTPVGCTRPYKAVVPAAEWLEARELVEHVLDGRDNRYEVLLPADDAWALRYQLSAVVLPLVRLSKTDSFWLFVLWLLRAYVVGILLLALGSLVSELFAWLTVA